MNQATTYTVIAIVVIFVIRRLFIRLRLSRAKHPSLRGHVKMSRRIASIINFFEYDEARFFCSDGAPENTARQRKAGFERLTLQAMRSMPKTIAFSASLESSISDLQFTTAYRVPFPYRNNVPKALKPGAIADETKGQMIKDLDGNWRYDVSGSYGVNVFGYEFYKECMEKGFAKVSALGPVLGPYHPVIRDNVEKLKAVSGLDEVSFHMSGTEAVMQAVRLARYHTHRTHLVRLCGAYHGWWDGVQPGVGNRRKTSDVYTLADLSENTLKVLETRNDIACVLINPMQALHPNADAAGDAALVNSERSSQFDRERYSIWLKKIRTICSQRNIVLIFDEVFSGFRLGYRGAQEYFGIQADLVTYGKTLGGGLPVGVVCGRHHLMKRYNDHTPANVSFSRGTFNSHPYVMGTMNEFLHRIESQEIQQLYHTANDIWNARVARLNESLTEKNLPLRIVNMHSILSVEYSIPCRYNWMLQFYLRAEGLELSWIGTGRMIMSLAFTEHEFNQIIKRFTSAAENMQNDQWWWQHQKLTNKSIKRQMLLDMLSARYPSFTRFLPQILANSLRKNPLTGQ